MTKDTTVNAPCRRRVMALHGTLYSGVTNNADGGTSSGTSETDRETSIELDKALEECHFHLDCAKRVSIGLESCS